MSATRLCICWCALCLVVSGQPPQSKSKEDRKRDGKIQKELQSAFEPWVTQDVAYIITDDELRAYRRLQNDEEREQFIEQFWLRRDPTPDTEENEFKEEHYRRIAYANEHFASGIPGSKTDRGRIYIIHGPPDEIEAHPSGGPYQRPPEQGGGPTITFPFEIWRYRYLEDIGNEVLVEFVDSTNSGEYRLTINPEDKNALAHTPMQGVAQNNRIGFATTKMFDDLDRSSRVQRPPKVRFRDLEEVVDSTVRFNSFPMKVRADFLRMTESTILTPVTIQLENSDLRFRQQDGLSRATVNLYFRVTSITGRPVTAGSDTIAATSAPELLSEFAHQASLYQKVFYLAPGAYRLNIVAKDVNSGNISSYDTALRVPQFDSAKLMMTQIILAGSIDKVASRSVNAGPFVIGDLRVRTRPSAVFNRDEPLGVYFQIYGPSAVKPQGVLEFQIVNNGSARTIFESTEDLASLPGAGDQLTIHKMLPLASLDPGAYTVKIAIRTSNGSDVLTRSAAFEVR